MSKTLTTKEYWDRYWGEGEMKHPDYDPDQGQFYSYKVLLEKCFEEVRKRLKVERLQVLDCGCGEGLILRFIAEQFDNVDVYGIEYSDAIHKAARMGAELGHSFNLIHGDLFEDWDSQYLGKFDVVLSFGLIEHFERPEEVLAQMAKLLKTGGALVTVVPNFAGLFNYFWKLFDPRNHAYHIPIGHDELVELHRKVGLRDVDFFTIGTPVVPAPHDPNTVFERMLKQSLIYFNGYFLQRVFPRRQKDIYKRVWMVPNVACMCIK